MIIQNKEETILNIPIRWAIGLLFAGFFSVAGLAAAFVADYEIKVVTKEGEEINLNAYMEKAKESINSSKRLS